MSTASLGLGLGLGLIAAEAGDFSGVFVATSAKTDHKMFVARHGFDHFNCFSNCMASFQSRNDSFIASQEIKGG